MEEEAEVEVEETGVEGEDHTRLKVEVVADLE